MICFLSILTDGEISHSGRIQILEDGSLLISKVRSTDRGKYTCIRANEAGSTRGHAYLSGNKYVNMKSQDEGTSFLIKDHIAIHPK